MVLVSAVSTLALPARAQPVPPLAPDAGALPAAPAYDDDATYRRAMDAFTTGRYAEAADAFDEVAAQSPDAGRRAAAGELAVQARTRVAAPPAAGGLAIPPAPDTTVPPTGGALDTGRPAPPATDANERGQGPRAALLTGSTLLGLTLYGAGVPTAFDLWDSGDDGRLAVGTYLLLAASSFFVPYLLTTETPPTWGQAAAALHGAYNGAWHGLFFYYVLAGDWENGEAMMGASVLTSLVEGIGGYALAGYTDMTAGEAHAMQTGTLLGAGLLAGTTLAIGGEDGDPDVFMWMAVLGILGGGVGGRLIAEAETFSWGDVEAIQTGAALGLLATTTLAIDAEMDSVSAFAGLGVLGGIGGAVLAERILAGRDLLAWQGLVLDAATFLGGGAGAGLAFFFGSEDLKLTMTCGALAAAAGFGLTLLAFDIPREEDADAEDDDASAAPADFSLAPWFDGRGGQGLAVNGRF